MASVATHTSLEVYFTSIPPNSISKLYKSYTNLFFERYTIDTRMFEFNLFPKNKF